jgi:polysaccharide deacetylase family protein (PEP-CTERM system associated)
MTDASRIVNALSVDVEDYYHVSAFEHVVARERWKDYESRVVRNTERLMEVFEASGVRATFFVLGWVGDREPALVRRIADAGHEVASHGFSHRLVYEQAVDEFRADVRRSKATLEDVSGQAVVGYRAPSFSVTSRSLWALDVLIEESFLYDASVFPIHHDRYGIPSSPRHPYLYQGGAGSILEIPASTVRLGGLNLPMSGGGYFRLLPYGWTRWGIARVNEREGRPIVFYLHPWEVDPDQPRLEAPRLSTFRHYRNLGRTVSRLTALLRDFRFGTIADTMLVPTAPAA